MKIYNSDIINELLSNNNNPKAIFLAGPAGSGKSYITSKLLPSSFKVINSDIEYEKLLKQNNIGLKQKDFSPEELSLAAKLQFQARKQTTADYISSVENRENIIIDGTAAAVGPILKKKKELEDQGYSTLMLMIYVSPLLSLERNKNRDRSLLPSIILRTWKDVVSNINEYRILFGDNFLLINNNINDITPLTIDNLKPYLEDSKAKGKEKSEEEKIKYNEKFNQLIDSVIKLQTALPKFNTFNDVKSKINKFILK